jgi:hypothetical protein
MAQKKLSRASAVSFTTVADAQDGIVWYARVTDTETKLEDARGCGSEREREGRSEREREGQPELTRSNRQSDLSPLNKN